MKILSAAEIREWDQYTIQHEPVTSIGLMERASLACTNWIMENFPEASSFSIYCGKGNNGGDGLAIARMLVQHRYKVTVHILEFGHKGTDDFQTNLARLHQLSETDIHFIQSGENIHPIPNGQIIIDALFGSGLNRSLEGLTAAVVEHMNASGNEIVAIDIPSGMFTDRSSKGALTVHADHTLSFQCYKPAFLFAENSDAIGEIHILDIGLHPGYYENLQSNFEMVDQSLIYSIYQPRKAFAHKGSYGHALLIAGSYGKMGAAVLAAGACLRSGAGLLSCHIPSCGYAVMQTAIPEAMVMTDFNSSFATKVEADLSMYTSIGCGPGIGTAAETKTMLKELLSVFKKPMVLDADALNILASQKELLQFLPAGTVLTPHPKEFERLFGHSENDFERVLLALKKAHELNAVIVLKGHHTFIATPGGKGFFNSTGNAGMATAGAGDVLTGILTGLLAQGYAAIEATILGVYIHGLAGDMAAADLSKEAMIAGDITAYLGKAFLSLQRSSY